MRLKAALKPLFVRFVRLLPTGAILFIKQNVPMVQKMDYTRRDVYMSIDSQAERQSRANSCAKEPGTVAWIETFKKGDVLYDIGANVGPYALIAAAYLEGEGKIVAMEPHPQSYSKLCRNVLLNGFGNILFPLPVALSDKTGLDVFNYQYLVEGSAGHALGDAVDSSGKAFEPVGAHSILAYRLDDLVKELSLPAPSHIKIDVDGIELKVLRGASETLRTPSLRSVLVELEKSEQETAEAVTFMKERGFALREVYEGRNHLFTR